MRRVDVLLIGGGIASASAAAELRQQGFDGSICVVTREADAPYHRPPVTKAYLQGRSAREDALVHPGGWWEENEVELLTRASVMSLDPEARTVALATKEEIAFEQALLATGAMVRRLRVEGAQLQGIHYLRALGNADALRANAADAEHLLVVGGSYIGTEVAASLTALGKRCTILMQEEVTLERSFGATAGRFFHQLLESKGITIVGGESLAAFEGVGERVAAAVTESGRRIEADVVVVGAGAVPDASLAQRAGLAIGETGGVACDARLHTSADGVFAAGDACEYDSVLHGRRLRVEHEDVAAEQGRTAARNMMGADEPHRAVPYFFSDLADWASLEYVGPATSWDEEVIRGSIEAGSFSVSYLDGGRVAAVLSVGRPEDLEAGRAELAARAEALA